MFPVSLAGVDNIKSSNILFSVFFLLYIHRCFLTCWPVGTTLNIQSILLRIVCIFFVAGKLFCRKVFLKVYFASVLVFLQRCTSRTSWSLLKFYSGGWIKLARLISHLVDPLLLNVNNPPNIRFFFQPPPSFREKFGEKLGKFGKLSVLSSRRAEDACTVYCWIVHFWVLAPLSQVQAQCRSGWVGLGSVECLAVTESQLSWSPPTILYRKPPQPPSEKPPLLLEPTYSLPVYSKSGSWLNCSQAVKCRRRKENNHYPASKQSYVALEELMLALVSYEKDHPAGKTQAQASTNRHGWVKNTWTQPCEVRAALHKYYMCRSTNLQKAFPVSIDPRAYQGQVSSSVFDTKYLTPCAIVHIVPLPLLYNCIGGETALYYATVERVAVGSWRENLIEVHWNELHWLFILLQRRFASGALQWI